MLITDIVFLLNVLLAGIAIYAIIVITKFAKLGIKALNIYISKNNNK